MHRWINEGALVTSGERSFYVHGNVVMIVLRGPEIHVSQVWGRKTCRVLFPTLRIHKIIFLNVFPLYFTSKNGFQVEIPTYRGKIKAIPMELHYV